MKEMLYSPTFVPKGAPVKTENVQCWFPVTDYELRSVYLSCHLGGRWFCSKTWTGRCWRHLWNNWYCWRMDDETLSFVSWIRPRYATRHLHVFCSNDMAVQVLITFFNLLLCLRTDLSSLPTHTRHPDLFWALRGGVITSTPYKTYQTFPLTRAALTVNFTSLKT